MLVSQPAPSSDKSPFSELISNYKVEIDFRPFIRVEGVDLKEFRAQRVDILAHTAVIFTSRKTIDNFFRICEEARITVPEDLKYFCVTEAIALYLQKYIVYRKRKIFYGSGTFATLMDVVAKHKSEKYLVALSNPHKAEISQLLTKTGVKFTKVILAHTISADLSDIDLGQYDLVACYSSADIRALNENFKTLPQGLIIAALGNATAREAVLAGLHVDIVAPTPKYPSLTMAIGKYIEALNAGKPLTEFAYEEPVAEKEETPVKKKATPTKATTAKKTPAKTTAKKPAPKKADAKTAPKKPAAAATRKAV